jgi:hypothetical protein
MVGLIYMEWEMVGRLLRAWVRINVYEQNSVRI